MAYTPKSDKEVRELCADQTRLVSWALYESPVDYPGKWVTRLWLCDQGPEPIATTFCYVADSRDEVIGAIPLIDKGRWAFVPEYDPTNPQIIGMYI